MDEPELGRDLDPGPDDGVSGLDRLGGDLVTDEAYADTGFDEGVDHRFAVGFDDSRGRGDVVAEQIHHEAMMRARLRRHDPWLLRDGFPRCGQQPGSPR